MIKDMHTNSIYIVIKYYNNLNELFTLTLYCLVILYCLGQKIHTKSI